MGIFNTRIKSYNLYYRIIQLKGAIMYDFNPLWDTMKNKQISTYKLIETYHVSKGTLDRLKNNKNVTIETLARLCIILECSLDEIVNIHM